MELGNLIYNLRTEKKMTLEQVGNFVGVGKSTVRKWEKGLIENMKIDKIEKLAKCFGVSIDYLLSATEITEHLPMKRAELELSEKFLKDYAELLKDKTFMDTTKLFNEITPELRALAFGYIVGILQKYGVNTQKILGY